MTETLHSASGKTAPRRLAKLAVNAVALAALAAVLAILAVAAFNRPVTFDGAMNLQVAQALADGQGYVRDYDGVRPFPREVQTNVPFVLPSALVFRAFGIGLAQSQAVNFLYLAALAGLIVLLVSRYSNLPIGVLAALACLVVPSAYLFGSNGLGELIALFWWLAGTYLLLAKIDDDGLPTAALAGGICLGLALATKTVLMIGLAGSMAVYGLWLALETGRDARRRLVAFARMLAGVLLPLAIIELWRWGSLGSFHEYLAWWLDQSGAIAWQAGVAPDAHATAGPLAKLTLHLQLLALQTGLPLALLVAWLLIPFCAWLPMMASLRLPPGLRRLWFALWLVAAIYVLWWLILTPTSKAIPRRLVNGLILVQALWFIGIGRLLQLLGQRDRGNRLPLAVLCLLVMLVPAAVDGLFALGFRQDLGKDLATSQAAFQQAVRVVQALPPEAKVFGKGWLSAPALGLYSRHHVDDINLFSAGDLERIGVGYLLIDPAATHSGRFAPELKRFQYQTLFNQGPYQIYRVDFRRKRNPFQDYANAACAAPASVDFTRQKYDLVYGMHAPEKKGQRWATTDAEILLSRSGQRLVEITLFQPRMPYVKTTPLTLEVSVDGCKVGRRAAPTPGFSTLTYPIPDSCPETANRLVRLQVQSDNMLQVVQSNQRQMSYIVTGIGFKDAAPAGAPAASAAASVPSSTAANPCLASPADASRR